MFDEMFDEEDDGTDYELGENKVLGQLGEGVGPGGGYSSEDEEAPAFAGGGNTLCKQLRAAVLQIALAAYKDMETKSNAESNANKRIRTNRGGYGRLSRSAAFASEEQSHEDGPPCLPLWTVAEKKLFRRLASDSGIFDPVGMATAWNTEVTEKHKNGEANFLFLKTPEELMRYHQGSKSERNREATMQLVRNRTAVLVQNLEETVSACIQERVAQPLGRIAIDRRPPEAARTGELMHVAHPLAASLEATDTHLRLEDSQGAVDGAPAPVRKKRGRRTCQRCGRFRSNFRAPVGEIDEMVELHHKFPRRGKLECTMPEVLWQKNA